MNIQDYYKKKKKERDYTSQYLIGKKFNTQAGDKEKQSFFVKLLPRIPDEASKICEGPFYEFWIHRNCGPDGQQALICLNRTREEFKSNKKKCPACLKIRKILNNENNYSADAVDKAKEQKAQNRILWAVYDLATRMEVQFLEISNKANDSVMNEFMDTSGEFLDITKLSNKSCLQITRTGSGFASSYAWRSLVSEKFALKKPDGTKIKATYKFPEDAIKVIEEKEFKDIFESAFEVESSNDTIDDGITNAIGDDLDIDDLGEDKKEKKNVRERTPVNKSKKPPKTTKDDDDLGIEEGDEVEKESDNAEDVLGDLDEELANL